MPTATLSHLSSPPPLLLQSASSLSPLKRKAMSITQTYYLAHTARGKLSAEAARADHNLRLLVGHANLLDSLMLELAQAEQEQESWFNQSVKGATREESSRHIQWADTVVEEPGEDWQAEDADSDSDEESEEDDEDDYMEDDMDLAAAGMMTLQRVASHSTTTMVTEVEAEDDDSDDDTKDYPLLILTRSHSHSASPPELVSPDSEDDSSEDESMPPSPPNPALPSFSEKERQQIATTSFYSAQPEQQKKLAPSEQAAFFDEGYYLPQRRTPSLVTGISVY